MVQSISSITADDVSTTPLDAAAVGFLQNKKNREEDDEEAATEEATATATATSAATTDNNTLAVSSSSSSSPPLLLDSAPQVLLAEDYNSNCDCCASCPGLKTAGIVIVAVLFVIFLAEAFIQIKNFLFR